MSLTKALRTTCLVAFGILPAACAQQPQPAPMSGMSGMSGMAGMDMQTMMNHCAQMRQDVGQGKQLAPDMQKMMAQCDQMNRSMTMGAPASAPPPAATLSR